MKLLIAILKPIFLLIFLAALVGSAAAFFLWSLDAVTRVRFDHAWLLFLLPIAGSVMAWIYKRYGGTSSEGNQLLFAELQKSNKGVPRRMAPFILFATLITHLFGGSAGREGTALQIGGSIAASIGRFWKIHGIPLRLFLLAGIAAGFGAVFGTPFAGAVFALEATRVGKIRYIAFLPCLVAALMADAFCQAWGAHHFDYFVRKSARWFDLWMLVKVILAAFLFGLTSRFFVRFSHWLSRKFEQSIKRVELRAFIGGLLIIGLFYLAGRADYLGLGTLAAQPGMVTIGSCFHDSSVPASAWLWKLIFTVVTLSAGFKGGEVTPLFFIGAALGNALASVFHVPIDLFAALGMVALFAGASKAPLACIILGVELFGAEHFFHIAVACWVAHRFSGKMGIYPAPVVKKFSTADKRDLRR